MKPLFATDLTHDKRNTKPNGIEFLKQSYADDKALSARGKLTPRDMSGRALKIVMYVLETLLSLSAVAVSALIMYRCIDLGLALAYEKSSPLFWCAICSIVVWTVFTAIFCKYIKRSKKKARRTAYDVAVDTVYSELGVPDNATPVDILTFSYKIVDGQPEAVTPRSQYTKYINLSVRMYVEDDKLFIADLASVYSIDLDMIKRIIPVDKKITFPYWNKPTSFKSAPYKRDKISYRYGVFRAKKYYIILITKDRADYGIYIPGYELKAIEKLTGLRATKS